MTKLNHTAYIGARISEKELEKLKEKVKPKSIARWLREQVNKELYS